METLNHLSITTLSKYEMRAEYKSASLLVLEFFFPKQQCIETQNVEKGMMFGDEAGRHVE